MKERAGPAPAHIEMKRAAGPGHTHQNSNAFSRFTLFILESMEGMRDWQYISLGRQAALPGISPEFKFSG